MKKQVIMVDLDGTISDSAWRNKFAPNNGGSWKLFHSLLGDDKPTKMMEVVKSLSTMYHIVFSTARPEYSRVDTMNWLAKHADFDIQETLMRSDFDLLSTEVKLDHMRTIKDSGYDIALVIDDRGDVCKMYNDLGISTLLVSELTNTIPVIGGDLIADYTPDKILKDASELFKRKNVEYGDAYKKFGELLGMVFPDGIHLKTKSQLGRWGAFCMVLLKVQRYTGHFLDGGHDDSLDDLMVYTAMLKELDLESQ